MKFLKIISKKNLWFLLPALSGILLFLAYPPQSLWFLAWFALIPLFYFLFSEKTTPKHAFWGGTICGFIFMGGLFIWLFQTAPFEWLGVNSQKGFVTVLILMIILWIFQIGLLALFWGLFSWITKKIINKYSGFFPFLIIVPMLWIIFEYLRSWWFEFIWLGKETFFGPHWTFGILAYSLHKIPQFIQSADIWGIYGISLLIIIINAILYLVLKSVIKKKKMMPKQIIASIIIIFLVFSFLLVYGNYKLNHKENGQVRKVALIQTEFISDNSFNVYQNKEAVKTILGLFQKPESIRENPDYVIAPEGQGIVSIYNDTKIAQYMLGNFWKPGQIYLESKKIIDENQKIKARLFYYDLENKNPLAYYEKRLLVANGDFLPYISKFFMSIYTYKGGFEKRLYQKGEVKIPAQTPKGVVGGTICSSVVSPQINRQMTNQGAEFLAVVASDAPFHKSNSLLEQNFVMSKFRAIENRRYFTQATNMGYSYLLDAQGNIVMMPKDFGNNILFADLQLLHKKTLYTKYGDWIILLAFIVLLFKLSYPQLRLFLLHKKKCIINV